MNAVPSNWPTPVVSAVTAPVRIDDSEEHSRR